MRGRGDRKDGGDDGREGRLKGGGKKEGMYVMKEDY